MEFLVYLALVRGPHESHHGAHLGGIAVEGRVSVRKEMRRGRNGEWAQGWRCLATTLSYQAPPLAARALIIASRSRPWTNSDEGTWNP